MKVAAVDAPISEADVDALVVGIYADQKKLEGAAAELDQATSGLLTRLLESQEITGKQAELTPLLSPPGVRARQVLVMGLGQREGLHPGMLYRAVAAASLHLSSKQRSRVAFCVDGLADARWIETGICAACVGCYGQDLYRREKKRHPFDEILWSGADENLCRSAQVIAEGVNLTRRLVNEPPSAIYPESFARAAEEAAREAGLEVDIWDQERLRQERCGSLLAVARGSARPPRLVILRHRGGAADGPPLALVGKGVTFDSGGLSLKPSDSMKAMKCDMAGAATVLGAMYAIGRLKLPINVIGLMGLVENMISGDSYKLGDVLTARNGKTIEVLNTDAEGRLVLADVLCVAVEQKPTHMIDLATLTGACVVALGTDVAGLMTNNPAWCETVSQVAQQCGEPAWQLPMFPEYGELIKSEVADIKNVSDSRWGGAIVAAKFLEHFVGQTPWTHIDIAGPAFQESPKPWSDGGATGAFVRTLVEVARSHSD